MPRYRLSNALNALISPPSSYVDSAWPYPDAPDDSTRSLPKNLGLSHCDDRDHKYSVLGSEDSRSKNRKSFVMKIVNKLNNTSKSHQAKSKSLDSFDQHSKNNPFSAPNTGKNNPRLDQQYEIYKDRFERSENEHHHISSSQYMAESMKSTQSNAFSLNANKNETLQERQPRVIELEESKFSTEIVEDYNVFITTFNMVCKYLLGI